MSLKSSINISSGISVVPKLRDFVGAPKTLVKQGDLTERCPLRQIVAYIPTIVEFFAKNNYASVP